MRRRATQPELKPIYVRPKFDARERAAMRDWRAAVFRGERQMPKPGEFDPLHLRMGMRACLVSARAGWVVSNPLYDRSLVSNPATDPSLAGLGWLREVYVYWRGQRFTTLPRVRDLLNARRDDAAREEAAAAPKTQLVERVGRVVQSDLFAQEAA